MISEIKTNVTEVLSSSGEKLKSSLSFLKDLKEAGDEKIRTLVNDVLGLAPLIEVTGFNMNEVNLDAGIPPGMTVAFVKEKDVDPETINKMLEENKGKELLKLIVTALEKADTLQKGMNLSHYKFTGLNMTIGLPPQVSLKFLRSGGE